MVRYFWLGLPLLLGAVVKGQGGGADPKDNEVEWRGEGERGAGKSAQLKADHWKRLWEKWALEEGERIRVRRSVWVEQLRREWEARERQRADEEAAEARRAADEERRRWEEAAALEQEAAALEQAGEEAAGEEAAPGGGDGWREGAQWERRQASAWGQPWGEERRAGWEDQGPTASRVSEAVGPFRLPAPAADRRSPPLRGRFSPADQPHHGPADLARVPLGQRPQGDSDLGWIRQREREEAALAAQRGREERMEEERRRKEAEREAEEERDELEAREIERSEVF